MINMSFIRFFLHTKISIFFQNGLLILAISLTFVKNIIHFLHKIYTKDSIKAKDNSIDWKEANLISYKD